MASSRRDGASGRGTGQGTFAAAVSTRDGGRSLVEGRAKIVDAFYVVVRVIARFWIWFFFERVEVRHPERVPRVGPVLLCINHPNNLIDSLLVGSVLPRKVHYLATAALFRNPLIARLLHALGVIPVYRKGDDPAKMDRNMEMFAACDQALDRGRLVAIYPEGATRAPAHARAVQELYGGKLERELWEERGLSGRQIDPFQLSGAIADATEHFRKQDPERIERLWQRILGYRALLAAYRLRNEAVRTGLKHAPARRRVARSRQAIVGLPLFVCGAAVNFLPYYLPGWLAGRMARRE